MPLIKIKSAALIGLDASLIDVEVDSIRGLPGQTIVGLPDIAVKESRDRVKIAIVNSGFQFPPGYFTINLAPADLKKEGPIYDLPIALGVLAASKTISIKKDNFVAFGELSLDGSVKPIAGILPLCDSIKHEGINTILVPFDNANEAALVAGLNIIPINNLMMAIKYLGGNIEIKPYSHKSNSIEQQYHQIEEDFIDVKGNLLAKRALEIAAAGGHNILLVGPPGVGKTMLVRRIPGILPPISKEEAIEITKIYSISGLVSKKKYLIDYRPFRAPHHTASDVSVVGGGRIPRPGEISLAHNGVLFLDEFPEFPRKVLEVLRQPLEDGKISISRAQKCVEFPASFMLVAAMNPCPCGNLGSLYKACSCSAHKVGLYWNKLSGPIIDRIDLQIELPSLKPEEMVKAESGETSNIVKQRVAQAYHIQLQRYKSEKIFQNSRMTTKIMKKYLNLSCEAEDFIKKLLFSLKMSGRAHNKILKVARTIADLEQSDLIKKKHIAEASQYRFLDQDRRS